jgi:hypothetical protein
MYADESARRAARESARYAARARGRGAAAAAAAVVRAVRRTSAAGAAGRLTSLAQDDLCRFGALYRGTRCGLRWQARGPHE